MGLSAGFQDEAFTFAFVLCAMIFLLALVLLLQGKNGAVALSSFSGIGALGGIAMERVRWKRKTANGGHGQ